MIPNPLPILPLPPGVHIDRSHNPIPLLDHRPELAPGLSQQPLQLPIPILDPPNPLIVLHPAHIGMQFIQFGLQVCDPVPEVPARVLVLLELLSLPSLLGLQGLELEGFAGELLAHGVGLLDQGGERGRVDSGG